MSTLNYLSQSSFKLTTFYCLPWRKSTKCAAAFLTHKGPHIGTCTGVWLDHRFRAPPAYIVQLLTLHQHRVDNLIWHCIFSSFYQEGTYYSGHENWLLAFNDHIKNWNTKSTDKIQSLGITRMPTVSLVCDKGEHLLLCLTFLRISSMCILDVIGYVMYMMQNPWFVRTYTHICRLPF